jgi:hypothetical protein
MPDRSTVPNLGKKCGRRERESRRGGRRERSLRETHPPRVVTVKGILVFWMASLFAGRRRNGGLDRPDSVGRHPPLHAVAPMTADVRRTPRRGARPTCTATKLRSATKIVIRWQVITEMFYLSLRLKNTTATTSMLN